MAISRRLILKLGVSYGTGAINFGNDSIAYDRELRKLPDDPTFGEFMDALTAAMESIANDCETGDETDLSPESSIGESGADAETPAPAVAVAETSTAAAADATAGIPSGSEAVEVDDIEDDAAVEGLAADGDPEENPLDDAVVKAHAFRQLCARLALSDLFVQTKAITAALEADELPSPDELKNLSDSYAKLIEYLQTC